MTTDTDHRTYVRLEEVLENVKTLDGQLADPLSLGPSIRNLEETIEAYERLGLDNSDTPEGS